MSNVQLGYTQVIDPISFKSIPSGKIYIGEYGTLPNPANAGTWKQAYFVNSDGTRTAASQPIATNAAGYAVDGSGNIKSVQVDGQYSILVQSSLGATKFSAAKVAPLVSAEQVDIGNGRTQADKNADFVSLLDYGAIGDGVADDTSAIDAMISDHGGGLFPQGVYQYTGDPETIFSAAVYGPGKVRIDGYDYPLSKEVRDNHLWAGEFRCWPMGNSFAVETTGRIQVPSGVTHARSGLTAGTTVYHVNGINAKDAMRVQRNSGNSDTSTHTAVLNLTQEETKPLLGKSCVLQFGLNKGSGFTGSGVTVKLQYSTEPEQPILSANGAYTSGNVELLNETFIPTVTGRKKGAPYFYTATIPDDAVQVSVAFRIPWTGTAGADDYVEIEDVVLATGDLPVVPTELDFASLMRKSSSRYQSSYNYGTPRGVNTEQGSVQAIAVSTAVNWAFAINVRFDPPMPVPPQFIFQSPTSSTESRLLNKDASANINGLAFNLGTNGVTITNNAAGVVGNRYLCQWTAQAIF